MRISKWVDFGQEVEVDIDAEDIRGALSEAFQRATQDPLDGTLPHRADVLRAINSFAAYLKAISDDQIQDMTLLQRSIIWTFLSQQAARFEEKADA